MEEEEDETEDVIPSLQPILPRVINFELGTSVQKRSFSYDLPTMQGTTASGSATRSPWRRIRC